MLPAVGSDRVWIYVLTINELYQSASDVFTPSQTNCTQWVNAPAFDSTGLNKAGVKTPVLLKIQATIDTIIPNYTVITNQIGDPNTQLQDLSLIRNHIQCHSGSKIQLDDILPSQPNYAFNATNIGLLLNQTIGLPYQIRHGLYNSQTKHTEFRGKHIYLAYFIKIGVTRISVNIHSGDWVGWNFENNFRR